MTKTLKVTSIIEQETDPWTTHKNWRIVTLIRNTGSLDYQDIIDRTQASTENFKAAGKLNPELIMSS